MTTDQIGLPPLTRARQDEIERALFGEIAAERSIVARRARTRRRRGWSIAAAAAAVVVLAGVVGPTLAGAGFSTGAGGAANESQADRGADAAGGFAGPETGVGEDLGEEGGGSEDPARREVFARASVSLQTEDAADAAERIGKLAEDAGGYVEAMSVAADEGPTADAADAADDPVGGWSDPYGVPLPREGGAWVTVRVPASELTDVMRALDPLGEVQSSEIAREDVTSQTTDLRARVAALESSADRLRGLITDATSTADLLAAEDALAERQAELDALRAQLKGLDEQVALSSLSVSISTPPAAVEADPQGFGDGLATGWNALVAALNGTVIGLGFLLPWLALAGSVLAVVQLVRRAARRRRQSRAAED